MCEIGMLGFTAVLCVRVQQQCRHGLGVIGRAIHSPLELMAIYKEAKRINFFVVVHFSFKQLL